RRIPVEFVVRRELVMPFELAGVGIDRDDGGAVEIVSNAVVAVVVGTGVAGAPHREVRLGIIGTGNPDGGSAMQVRVVGFTVFAEPCLVAGLAGSGNRVKAPDLLTRVHVERSEKAADTVFAAGDAGDHLILDGERRYRHRVLLLVVGDLNVPEFFA